MQVCFTSIPNTCRTSGGPLKVGLAPAAMQYCSVGDGSKREDKTNNVENERRRGKDNAAMACACVYEACSGMKTLQLYTLKTHLYLAFLADSN